VSFDAILITLHIDLPFLYLIFWLWFPNDCNLFEKMVDPFDKDLPLSIDALIVGREYIRL
jgi:hypothetical protein